MKHLLLPSPLPLHLHGPPSKPFLFHVRQRQRHLYAPSAAPDGNSGDTSTVASEPSADTKPSPPPSTPPSTNSSTTSVKNRLRSRNQARRAPEAYLPPVEVRDMRGKGKGKGKGKGRSAAEQAPRKEKPRRKKEWDEMSLSEKAMELYVGEKGALFWLNKFAYASIFIMAGAWILFRFVGPATGLYQLDAPPLAPTDVLRGS